MNADRGRAAAETGARPAVRVRRGAAPEAPMRVYIWSGSSPPGSEGGAGEGDAAGRGGVVIELTAWLRVFMVAAGSLVALPLAGLIGFRHGFAECVRVPDLQREFGASMSDGLRLVLASPRRVFEAGLIDTAPLLLALLLVVVGAAALALAVFGPRAATAGKEPSAGAPPAPSAAGRAASAFGLVVCALAGVSQIGWVIARSHALSGQDLPWAAEPFEAWSAGVRLAAGVDLLTFAAAILWLLAAVRLRWMLWLRALTLVIVSSAVAALFAAASISNTIAAQVDQVRSLVAAWDEDAGSAPDLILGHTRSHLVIVGKGGRVELTSPAAALTIVGRASIAEFVDAGREAR